MLMTHAHAKQPIVGIMVTGKHVGHQAQVSMYPPPHTTRMLCVECGWALVRCAYGFRS